MAASQPERIHACLMPVQRKQTSFHATWCWEIKHGLDKGAALAIGKGSQAKDQVPWASQQRRLGHIAFVEIHWDTRPGGPRAAT